LMNHLYVRKVFRHMYHCPNIIDKVSSKTTHMYTFVYEL
jgi:hypothetical protein